METQFGGRSLSSEPIGSGLVGEPLLDGQGLGGGGRSLGLGAGAKNELRLGPITGAGGAMSGR